MSRIILPHLLGTHARCDGCGKHMYQAILQIAPLGWWYRMRPKNTIEVDERVCSPRCRDSMDDSGMPWKPAPTVDRPQTGA